MVVNDAEPPENPSGLLASVVTLNLPSPQTISSSWPTMVTDFQEPAGAMNLSRAIVLWKCSLPSVPLQAKAMSAAGSKDASTAVWTAGMVAENDAVPVPTLMSVTLP